MVSFNATCVLSKLHEYCRVAVDVMSCLRIPVLVSPLYSPLKPFHMCGKLPDSTEFSGSAVNFGIVLSPLRPGLRRLVISLTVKLHYLIQEDGGENGGQPEPGNIFFWQTPPMVIYQAHVVF
jgi:hypothetical protein